jgi:intracellular septation protein A
MNNQILKQLSFAFFPILVFIIADELYGVIIGMAVAMIFSGAEFIYTMYKHKNVDFFILFDVLLISILGGISIVSHNDIFFKLNHTFFEKVLFQKG